MPLHNEYFYNEESGKKRMQGVVSLFLTDYKYSKCLHQHLCQLLDNTYLGENKYEKKKLIESSLLTFSF